MRIKKSKYTLVAMIFIFVTLNTTVLASSTKNFKAGVVIEANSGKVLYEYNKDALRGQASITKAMTYLVFRDFIQENSISQSTKVKINISPSAASMEGGGIGLKKGNTITTRELYETLLIKSANDSALVMADYYKSRTKKDFVKEMNKKAKSLGLKNTYYINPHGLTDKSNPKSHKYNKTTSYETALLVNHIIKKYPDTLKITSKKSCTYGNRTLTTTNRLLSIRPGADGFKTGYTTVAGFCLAGTEDLTRSNGRGKPFRLIAVVFGASSADSRARECANLLEYGKRNFTNNSYGGLAESISLEAARNKVSQINGIIKSGNLDSKDQVNLERYIKESKSLINKIPTLEKKEGIELLDYTKEAEKLLGVISKINALELSIEKNSKTEKNIPQWEEYIKVGLSNLDNVNKKRFSVEYSKILDRIKGCQDIVNSIKVVA